MPGNAQLPVPLQGAEPRKLTQRLRADNFQIGLVGDHFLLRGLLSICKKDDRIEKLWDEPKGSTMGIKNLAYMLVERPVSTRNALTLKLQLLKQILNWVP